MAVVASTLTTIAVFLPLVFVEGIAGQLFRDQALTVALAIAISLVVSMTLIPMLSSLKGRAPLAFPEEPPHPKWQPQSKWQKPLAYTGRGIGGALRFFFFGIAWAIVRAWRLLVGVVGPVMFGGDDAGEIDIFYQWKGAYTKEQMSDEILKVEKYLDANRKKFHIDQVFSRYREQGWAGTNVKLDTQDGDEVRKITEEIRKDLPKSARATIGIGDQGGPGGDQKGKEIQVMLVGDSTQTLNDLAADVVPVLAQRKELRDVRVDNGDQNSELAVHVDRERAASFGFSANDVATFVGLALRGAPLREFRRGDTEVPVWVRFAGADNYSTEDLASFTVRAPDGRSVPLLAMVDVQVRPAASQIERTNRQTTLTITANIADKVVQPDARKAIDDTLKGIPFPAGYSYSFDRPQFMSDDDAMKQMVFNLGIALLMIYVVMAAVFESLLFPSAIMSGVLFSIFGVFWLFWLTGTTFSIMASIGILILIDRKSVV